MIASECLKCGASAVETPEEVFDGDHYDCAACGETHQIMCDCETDPYLVMLADLHADGAEKRRFLSEGEHRG